MEIGAGAWVWGMIRRLQLYEMCSLAPAFIPKSILGLLRPGQPSGAISTYSSYPLNRLRVFSLLPYFIILLTLSLMASTILCSQLATNHYSLKFFCLFGNNVS